MLCHRLIGRGWGRAGAECGLPYRAAVTMISTVNCGAASFDSTQARHGVLPGTTQASHTSFISLKVEMSLSQICAESSFDLSLPASPRYLSMRARYVLGLLRDRRTGLVHGNLSGEIDGAVVDTGLAHAVADIVTFNGHCVTSLGVLMGLLIGRGLNHKDWRCVLSGVGAGHQCATGRAHAADAKGHGDDAGELECVKGHPPEPDRPGARRCRGPWRKAPRHGRLPELRPSGCRTRAPEPRRRRPERWPGRRFH